MKTLKKYFFHITFIFTNFFLLACQSTHVATPATSTQALPTRLSVGKKTVELETLTTLISEKDLAYKDPYEGTAQIARGVPLHLVLDSYAGAEWKSVDGILLRTEDGSKVNVSVAKILRYRPLLAYRYVDPLRKFQVALSPQHTMNLGPFYLVWDNLQFPELQNDATPEKSWAYQIVRIDLIRYSSEYAKRLRR